MKNPKTKNDVFLKTNIKQRNNNEKLPEYKDFKKRKKEKTEKGNRLIKQL